MLCFIFYLGQRIDPGEELVMDDQAYIVYHQANLGSPCLSFDVVTETNSGGEFPLQVYGVAGTQAAKANNNNIIVFKVCCLSSTLYMSHLNHPTCLTFSQYSFVSGPTLSQH